MPDPMMRRYKVRCNYRGRESSQEVFASNYREAINKATAVIAERSYDRAFNGDYTVYLGTTRVSP